MSIIRQIRQRNRRPRAAVMFVVLGMVAILSIIVTLFLELSLKKIREQAVNYQVDDLRSPAYSALEVTLGVLEAFREYHGSLTGPAQGWHSPIRFSNIPFDENLKVRVSIKDETGKFPILPNGENRTMLLDIFMGMGFDLSDAEILHDSLLDWIDEGDDPGINGGEEDYYEREGSYKPPNRPITSYSELRYIRGFNEWFFDENGLPNVKYQMLVNATSLHHQSDVNINTAPAAVWAIFSEMDGVDIDGVAYAMGGDDDDINTPEDNNIVDPSQFAGLKYVGSEMDVFKITVDVSRADSHFILNALVSADGGLKEVDPDKTSNSNGGESIEYPFTILQLAENQPIE